ncbi:MAG: prolyl oligopeptidase family serine peptidase [Pseudomonadota bacterium]|nr:prolyl oligopeptidase family serine peptidase [Pseudomonadota bacterium]
MSNALRFLKFLLWACLGLVATAGALLGYFVYSPDAGIPGLSGSLTKETMASGGLPRTYRVYVPHGLPKQAPLVMVLHGSGENGSQIRMQTGYGFDRLADKRGFAVVYPDAYTFDWNDCSIVGDFAANGRNVDDVEFLSALTDHLVHEIGLDPSRVYATGVSAGGFMSMRLALEASPRFRAIAAVSANVPAPGNFKCRPAGPGTSVLIVNGTEDPLVPFGGGEVNLLGLFYKGGNVLSSRDSGQYFAELAKISGMPEASQSSAADGVGVEQLLWRNDSSLEVELVAIRGGGHGMPQAAWRRPRLLGPSPMAPDGPSLIWAFFERQRQRP